MKSQALSIRTIIIAGIGLVVMILLILIFTSNIRGFNTSTKNCETNGGQCMTQDNCNAAGGVAREEPYNKWCQEFRDADICCLTT